MRHNKIKMPLQKFFQQEWADTLTGKAAALVPRPVLLAFTVSLAISIVCWFYDLAQFPLGDHDVGYQSGVPPLSGGRSGRWFAPVAYLFSGYVQIPVWTQLLAFSAQIAAGMATAYLWFRKADFLPLLAGGLLLSCMPTAADFYYYHWQAPTFTACQLLMALSIFFALHPAARQKRNTLPRLIYSVVLATCAIALYQSCVMTWSVLFLGCIVMYLLRAERAGAKDLIITFAPPFASFAAACLLYAASLRLYPLAGFSLEGEYQFRTLALGEMLRRVPEVVKAAYSHFFVLQPFMGPWLKGLLLVTSVGGFIALTHEAWIQKRGLGRIFLAVCGLLLLPVAAKAQFFISAGDNFYLFRFTSLGLNYVHLFFLLALLNSASLFGRNAGFALGLLLLPAMIINCLHQQVLHVRSNTHDLAVLNRVMARIEEQPGFSLEKTWNLVQFGRTTPYMARTYSPFYEDTGLSGFNGTISQVWRPGFAFFLVAADLKLAERMNEYGTSRPDILRKAVSFAEGKKSFPAPGSVGIVDDTIVLVLDEKAVEIARNRLSTPGGPQR
ncbi:MAG: glucosyltransferase domain-containing protein [Desulfovibrio sp.]|jgi:hypothetical protein|nr:glucosyltransferase domain-containing protein [Desulfovibrio sp.]